MEETERETSQEHQEEGDVEEKQQIWSWGAGTEGQLGTESLQDEHTPQLLSSLSSFATISHLSCGGAHVIALDSGGKVVTWGRGTSGQLGHGEMVNRLQPKVVKALECFFIINVSAGWSHSGFVSDTGYLFTCGDGSFGQLGHGDYNSRSSPERVSNFHSRHVRQIACGMRHSLALLQDQSGNQVYSFGSGRRGQLGVSIEKVRSVSLPQTSSGLVGVEIVCLYANGDHSAALSDDGQLYTWGRGFPGTSDIHIPHRTTGSLRVFQAAVGWNHALVLTEDGDALMLGSYGNGILHGRDTKAKAVYSSESEVVRGIPELGDIKVFHIAAGAEHSALVTDDGSVMAWGWGEHGQLGLGDTEDQASPKVVSCGKKGAGRHLSTRVFCGSGFTFVVKTPVLESSILREGQ